MGRVLTSLRVAWFAVGLTSCGRSIPIPLGDPCQPAILMPRTMDEVGPDGYTGTELLERAEHRFGAFRVDWSQEVLPAEDELMITFEEPSAAIWGNRPPDVACGIGIRPVLGVSAVATVFGTDLQAKMNVHMMSFEDEPVAMTGNAEWPTYSGGYGDVMAAIRDENDVVSERMIIESQLHALWSFNQEADDDAETPPYGQSIRIVSLWPEATALPYRAEIP